MSSSRCHLRDRGRACGGLDRANRFRSGPSDRGARRCCRALAVHRDAAWLQQRHGLVDRSILRSHAGIRAVSLSLAILTATALAQAFIYSRTLSVALLADLIHNFGDALTAIPLGLAFFLRSLPGEKLSGLAVVAAIFISAVVALGQTIERFIHRRSMASPADHLPVRSRRLSLIRATVRECAVLRLLCSSTTVTARSALHAQTGLPLDGVVAPGPFPGKRSPQTSSQHRHSHAIRCAPPCGGSTRPAIARMGMSQSVAR